MASDIGALQQLIDRVRPGVAAHVDRTPLQELSVAGSRFLVKSEHLQRTGSFKVRGALAKLTALGAAGRNRGVLAASSGNHGLGVAYALGALGGHGVIFVPENAAPVKVAAIAALGVEVRHVGATMSDTEAAARSYATEHQLAYISPYNDLEVIAGQGSVGVEICEQLGDQAPDVVVVAVGGGGLAAGIAAAVKARHPAARIVGASPANDAAMAASVRAGRIIDVPALTTLSDGTAGGIEPDAITFELCRDLIDDWVLVDEAEIRAAIRTMIDVRHQLVEGAAGVAIAAAFARSADLAGARTVIVSCGANISAATLRAALS